MSTMAITMGHCGLLPITNWDSGPVTSGQSEENIPRSLSKDVSIDLKICLQYVPLELLSYSEVILFLKWLEN